jgi:hypothetical protein
LEFFVLGLGDELDGPAIVGPNLKESRCQCGRLAEVAAAFGKGAEELLGGDALAVGKVHRASLQVSAATSTSGVTRNKKSMP